MPETEESGIPTGNFFSKLLGMLMNNPIGQLLMGLLGFGGSNNNQDQAVANPVANTGMFGAIGQMLGLGTNEPSRSNAPSSRLDDRLVRVDDQSVSQLVESKRIEGVLTSLSSAQDARQIAAVEGIGYFDGQDYRQIAPADRNNANVINSVITSESIKRVSITTQGNTRYFQQIDSVDGKHETNTGLKATAYVETDKDGNLLRNDNNQCQVRLCFGGYSGELNDGSAQTRSLNEVINGHLNPQTIEAAAFTDRVINSEIIGGKENISGVIFGAHSLGASNALTSHVVCDLVGVETHTSLLIEPAAASLAANKISEAMNTPHSALSNELERILQKNGLAADTGEAERLIAHESSRLQRDMHSESVSVRAITINADGKAEGTSVSYLRPGKGMQAGQQEEMMRRMGLIERDVLNPAENPHNTMVGTAVYIDVTGDRNVAPSNSTLARLDPNHSMANILDGLDQNAVLTIGQNMRASGINMVDRGQTAGPDGSKSNAPEKATDPTLVASNSR